MNDRSLYTKIISPENLRRAFVYACAERQKDYFYDPLEIKWYRAHEQELIEELHETLKEPENYEQESSFAYFPPKNRVCYRRMVFIPMRDLVVRYAFVSVIADQLDGRLGDRCFSNRRAKGDRAKYFLLEDYARGPWQNFVDWQREASTKHTVMLKTDISAFYDSVSHKYLEDVLRSELKLPQNSKVISLFQKILKVNIESYSHLDNSIQQPAQLHQGLPIGNNTEGFLANLYLLEIDRKMAKAGVEFGRYTDDMRMYATDIATLRKATMILQESLLKLGLNLNSSKTKLGGSPAELEEMRSKDYEVFDYVDAVEVEKENELLPLVDKGFKDQPKLFTEKAGIEEEDDAPKFCKYISWLVSPGKKPFTKVNKLKVWHVEKLGEIIRKYAGAGKHASWLLVMATFYDDVPQAVSNRAFQIITEILTDSSVNTYPKYRLTHFIISRGNYRYHNHMWIDFFPDETREWLKNVCISFLKQPAIELNLVAINAFRVLGLGYEDIKTLVETHSIQPLASPAQNALNFLEDRAMTEEAEHIDLTFTDEEVDYI